MAKNLLDEVLDDVEKLALQRFADDPITLEAVRKVLLAGVYYNGTLRKKMTPNPQYNFALSLAMAKGEFSDEQIGRDLRAAAEGVRMVQNAFSQIAAFKEDSTPQRSIKNPAV